MLSIVVTDTGEKRILTESGNTVCSWTGATRLDKVKEWVAYINRSSELEVATDELSLHMKQHPEFPVKDSERRRRQDLSREKARLINQSEKFIFGRIQQ